MKGFPNIFCSSYSSCYLNDVLLKTLTAFSLLDSEQAMHLYAHCKFISCKEEDHAGWKYVPKDVQKLCVDAVEKLSKHKISFFQHYQVYFEDQDKQKIANLHRVNKHLKSMVPEFITWYSNGDVGRIKTIFEAAKATSNLNRFGLPGVAEQIMTQLCTEIDRLEFMYTFEAVSLFSDNKLFLSSHKFERECLFIKNTKDYFEDLQSKAPNCLRLLLGSKHLRLVNKFFGTPLCVQHERILCSTSSQDGERHEVCSVVVDPDTALTTVSFKFDDNVCKLDASALDNVASGTSSGTLWRIRAVDKHHVKISTVDGNLKFPAFEIFRKVCKILN